MYRQGDLLFIRKEGALNSFLEVSSWEESFTAMKYEGKPLSILNSTVTGHSHDLSSGILYKRVRPGTNGIFAYFQTDSIGAQITHHEHGTINLPSGIYEVRRQREVTGYVRD